MVLRVVHLHLREPEGALDGDDAWCFVRASIRRSHHEGPGGNAAEGHVGSGVENERTGGDGGDFVDGAELGVCGFERGEGPVGNCGIGRLLA